MPFPSSLLTNIADNLASWPSILPEILLVITLVSVLGLAVLPPLHQRTWARPMAVLGVMLAIYYKYRLAAQLMYTPTLYLFGSLLVLDPLALFFCWLLLGLGLLSLIAAPSWLATAPGPVALMLSVLLGGCTLVMANHWLMFYLGLSLISLASASLMATAPTPLSPVASLQYMLYSMIIGSFMLWGMGYYYGLSGTLSISPEVWEPWYTWHQAITLTILLCCISGLFFSLTAAPFHFWAPGVYAQLPAGLVAYLSTIPKLAATGGILRLAQQLFTSPELGLAISARYGLGNLALLTMLVGNLGALQHTDWRRVLTYGGIAHGGLLLAGIAALPHSQVGVLYYGAIYGVINWAAWQGLQLLEEMTETSQDYAGLGRRAPVLGVSLIMILITLIGLPPTVGFTGKLLIWTGLWEQQCHVGGVLFAVLLGFSMLGTVFSLYYYFQLAYELWRPITQQQRIQIPSQLSIILVALAAILLLLGSLVQLV